MSDGVRVWAVDESDSLKELELSKLDYEERIENWISNNVSVLVPEESGLLIIGRQVATVFGGWIDLLCINADGDLVIVELKRGKTPREVTAQALDYASWVQDLTLQQVEEIATGYLKGKPLKDAFEDTFDKEYSDVVINGQHSIKIVASKIDDTTERIIQYLSGKGIAINFVRFHLFKAADGKEHLVRTFVVPLGQADKYSRRPKPHRNLQDKLSDETFSEIVREFLKQRLSDPKQALNKPKRTLVYHVLGTVRFIVWVKQSELHVTQKGRFAKDDAFWRDHLSAHSVKPRHHGKDLSFVLNTREDFKFFQDTMEQKIAGLNWSSAEADGDDEEEIDDEGQ